MSGETPNRDINEIRRATQEHVDPAALNRQRAAGPRSSAFNIRLIGSGLLASGLVNAVALVATITQEAAMHAEGVLSSPQTYTALAAISLSTSGLCFHQSSANSRTADVYLAAALAAEAQTQPAPPQEL